MRASEYGIKNLKRFYLIYWNGRKDGESYAELDELYGALTGQFRDMGHTLKTWWEFMIHLKRMT
jgi:hypothetical protein